MSDWLQIKEGFGGVPVSAAHPVPVSVAAGDTENVNLVRRYGYARGLGTDIQYGTPSTWVDLWAYGGQRTVQPLEMTTQAPCEIDMTGQEFVALTDWRVRIRDVSDAATAVSGSFLYSEVDV